MIGTFARVLLGFVLACVAAGFVQVLFIMPPVELLQLPAQAFPERASHVGVLALLAATHTAIFSAAFTLIAAGIGEWMRIRSAAYYLATGVTIAALGFSAQYASEVAGQPTIFNSYALTAFIASGVVAGLTYWAFAGRRAGGREADRGATSDSTSDTIGEAPAVRTWKNRPRIVVEDPIRPGSVSAKKASLAERLAEREEKAGDTRTVTQQTADGMAVATTQPSANGADRDDAAKTVATPSRMTSVPTTKSVSAQALTDAADDTEPKSPQALSDPTQSPKKPPV